MSTNSLSSEGRLPVAVASLVIGAGLVMGVDASGLLSETVTIRLLGPLDDFPFTIQMAEWLVFFVGLGEIWIRWRGGRREAAQIGRALLPEDDATVLQAGPDYDSLSPIYARAREGDAARVRFLPRLIQRIVLQFKAGRSVDQANSIMNSSLDMFMHEIDLRYSMLRYMVWLIPSLGFIGTVVGIADALRAAATQDMAAGTEGANMLGALTSDLGVAFDTTMLALLLSIVLVFLMHVVQGREEAALNRVGQYCLDNLINRLYEG